MIRILWALLFSISLFAGNVINQNIYEKENGVDIMLSFDAPFKGKIIQKKEEENRVFILEDTNIDEKTSTDIASTIIQKLQLIPYDNNLYIELSGQDDFEVDASKTVDNYGLRLRITPLTTRNTTKSQIETITERNFQTKQEEDISSAYLKVLLVLMTLAALLYFLKNWLQNRSGDFQGNWLFDKKESKRDSTIKIRQQKAIDVKNRLALISYKDKEYLLLIGTSNLLLDTFDASNESEENAFDQVLSENKEQLNDFINLKNSKINSYKQKISN